MALSRYDSERALAFLYSIGGFASLLGTICSAVVWLHWRVVLNTCAGNFQSYASYYDERDCGCILYGRDTLTYFVGSSVGYCYWATFGLIVPLFFCFIFGCYHVYRVCCRSNKPRVARMNVRQKSQEIINLTIDQEIREDGDDISPYFWTPCCIIALLMVVYTLVHSIMLTDGFFSTCKQYRNRIVKHVHATGQMVSQENSNQTQIAIKIKFHFRWPFYSLESLALLYLISWTICMKI